MAETKQEEILESLNELQERAVALTRQAYQSGKSHPGALYPMDVGIAGEISHVVQTAYQTGNARAILLCASAIEEVLAAYQKMLDAEDGSLELLRDALTELQELIS